MQHRKPDSAWHWLQLKRDAIRQILGFVIGEPPVDPFAQSQTPGVPMAAVATGPPGPSQQRKSAAPRDRTTASPAVLIRRRPSRAASVVEIACLLCFASAATGAPCHFSPASETRRYTNGLSVHSALLAVGGSQNIGSALCVRIVGSMPIAERSDRNHAP
jgi:cytochrome c5